MAAEVSTEPREAQIDRELDELGAKVLDGTANAEERARYDLLVAERTALMQPNRIELGKWWSLRRSGSALSA
jgi:hypothetical protein